MRVEWTPSFETQLRALPHWRTAAQVCRAVVVFAETGAGDVRTVRVGSYSLRVAGYRVRFEVEGAALIVWGVFRQG